MLNTTHTLRTPVAGALAALALASFGLAACGESSGGSSSQTSVAAKKALEQIAKARSVPSKTTSAPRSATGSGARPVSPRMSGLRACLEKSGAIAKGTSHSPFAAGLTLKGAKRTQFAAALRKCLGTATAGAGATRTPVPRQARAPRFKQALTKYAACLRQNGVPVSGGSGKSPLGLQGLDRSSPKFKSAAIKCRGVLAAAFRGGL
jgi:hypothetical protein